MLLDTFAGAGFGGFGADKVIQVAEAIDNNNDCCKSYKLNNRATKVKCMDIRNIDFRKNDYIGIMGLISTPPCQDFSVLNMKRDMDSDRANLTMEFIRTLKEIQPTFALFENVYSIPKKYKELLKKRIEEMGYKVTSQIVNAHEYGCYQIRRRWIMTIHKKKHIWPNKTSFRRKASELLDHSISEIRIRPETKEKIQSLPAGKWSALPGKNYKGYFVVDPDKPLPAVVNPTKLRYIKPDRSGYLSMNELIQAFGVTNYRLFGSLSSQGQQLANGFPADLMERFMREFKKYL